MSIGYKVSVLIHQGIRFILQDISDTYVRFIDINAKVTRVLVPLLIKINKSCPSTREDTHITNREYEDKEN